jgi:predicted DNA-binding WGR domain protein
MTRYFEFVGGSSAKFWEATVQGRDVTVRFGRLGTSGQSQTKTLPDAAAANKHAEELIAQKVDKGYVEAQLA